MAPSRQPSIRARLTIIFVLAIAVILTFTGIALVSLVHRSLLTQASNQIDAVMEQTQMRVDAIPAASRHRLILSTRGDVVVQVTNATGTAVWAASSASNAADSLPRIYWPERMARSAASSISALTKHLDNGILLI